MENSVFILVWFQISGWDRTALICQQGFGPLYFPNLSAITMGIGADGVHRVLAWYQRICPHTIEQLNSGRNKGTQAKYLKH